MANRGVNKVIILGNLGSDPDSRSMPNGNPVTKIEVATSEEWTDKNTGNQNKRTEWHKIVFYNRLAEIAAQYLNKGSKVYIEGSLRTRSWDDQATGSKKYITEIIGNQLQMVSSNSSQNQQKNTYEQQGYAVGSQNKPPVQEPINDLDDDIPFSHVPF